MSAARFQSIRVLGEKVCLRPHTQSDAEAAFELVHAREPILRWLVWQGPQDLQELRAAYASWVFIGDEASDYHFAIVERESERLVGSIGVRFSGHPQTGDVGYWLGEPYWGRGYVSEALGLVSHVAFEYLRAEVLCAWVFVGNEASRSVLVRNGYSLVRTVEGRIGQELSTWKDARKEWYYTLLRGEWQRSRSGAAPVVEVERDPGASVGE